MIFLKRLLFVWLGLVTVASVGQARVLRVELSSTEPVLQGRSFGDGGPYELLRGRVLFGVDPAGPMNRRIVDLTLAPRNRNGLVEAWADLVVLKPKQANRASGVALVEVSNRGGKFSMNYFNRATNRQLTATDPGAFGDGLLMELGLTVIWLGWQPDVPQKLGNLRLTVPTVTHPDGQPIYGLVRSDWTVDEPATHLPLSHREHLAYPAAQPDAAQNRLTVRDGRDAERRVIPRGRWQFARLENGAAVADPRAVLLKGGFEPGKIYELVYVSANPRVLGLGLAAVRDIIAFAKHDKRCTFPVRHGLAVGVSQTGRFLRQFLYQGFNTDERFRRAYDGLMVITAGAGRGSFNHRFGQPSRDAHRYSAFFYPTDIFPFTSRPQTDPQIHRLDGLLIHQPSHRPKTFYVNTGYEYWGRAASLIHTSPDGQRDVSPYPTERIYHLASAQHFLAPFPPAKPLPRTPVLAHRGNPLEIKVNYRALLVQLIYWVKANRPPPESAFPAVSNQTLVRPGRVRFPRIPGVRFPRVIHTAYRTDYGPRWPRGIVDIQPPRLGTPYPTLVSQVDRLGNESAGVRNIELRVPLATYTPWTLRFDAPAAKTELADFWGNWIPLPRTRKEKRKKRDPRPSLEQLYTGKADFLKKVGHAADQLINEGFLLTRDRQYVIDRSSQYWDWIVSRP